MDDDLYAVVLFEEGVEIIRREWSVVEEGLIVASYFPGNVSKQQLNKLLKSKTASPPEKEGWHDENGKPYAVTKVVSLAKTLECANKKLQNYIEWSEIESDEGRISEKIKRSRHSRCIKSVDVEYTDDSTTKTKRKALSEITNSLWNPPKIIRKENHHSNHDDELREEGTQSQPLHEDASSNLTDSIIDPDISRPTTSGQEKCSSKVSSNLTDSIIDPDISRPTTSRPKKYNLEVDHRTKLVLQSINDIKVYLKAHHGNGGQRKTKKMINFDSPDADLKLFPAKDKNEVEVIEEKLKSKEFFWKVVEATAYLGFSCNKFITINKMLSHLLDYKDGRIYSFEGRSGKKPAFKNLLLTKVIRQATKNSKKNNST